MSFSEVRVENMDKVHEVSQREGFFGFVGSDKYIPATYGIGPCVAVAGYSPNSGRGFLVHIDSMTDIDFKNPPGSFEPLKSLMPIAVIGTKGLRRVSYDITIVQGEESIELLERVKKYLEILDNLNPNLTLNVNRNHNSSDSIRSLALDLRTGKLFNYNPSLNPLHIRFTEARSRQLDMPSGIRWTFDKKLQDLIS